MKRKDHYLVQRVLDGEVSREEFDAFQQRLREEPELEKFYKEYTLVHHSLSEEFESGDGLVELEARGIGRGWVMALVGVLLVCVGGWIWWQVWSGAGAVARVEFTEDSVWQVEGEARTASDGFLLESGAMVKLDYGRLRIGLSDGGVAVADAPVKFYVPSGRAIKLEDGMLYFTEAGGMTVVSSSGERLMASGGEAIRVIRSDRLMRMTELVNMPPGELGQFRSVLETPLAKEKMRIEFGSPVVSSSQIDVANFEAFYPLPESVPGPGDRVLLATLEVGRSAFGEFHTDGWAGVSLYDEGEEVLFFGDAFGAEKTWALDLKQEKPVIKPQPSMNDVRSMTVRLESATGEVTLHPGGVPLSPPVCSGRLPVGTRFDEIRIGASVGAAIAVTELRIRVGAE
ncbi:MAG: hypothetical protein ACQCXQ_04355 [Verrucomicrobiales bacterium]